jgi:hypothetical protein
MSAQNISYQFVAPRLSVSPPARERPLRDLCVRFRAHPYPSHTENPSEGWLKLQVRSEDFSAALRGVRIEVR